METIFDHNITDIEYKLVVGDLKKDDYLTFMSQDTFYRGIALL